METSLDELTDHFKSDSDVVDQGLYDQCTGS